MADYERVDVVEGDTVALDLALPPVPPSSPAGRSMKVEVDLSDAEAEVEMTTAPVNIQERNPLLSDWSREPETRSLEEFGRSVAVPPHDSNFWRKAFTWCGPGLLVSVGYFDPGNWSTDILGGSAYGYRLLFVISVSSMFAMLLQSLALKVGLATQRDLAQCCRDAYPKPVCLVLWVVCELAIMATDLAEVIGSAVALKLLFHIPLVAGVCITSLDVLLFLAIKGMSIRIVELMVGSLILLITVCFAIQLNLLSPRASEVFEGFLPSSEIVSDSECLFVAVGIIGATVMPHNLFLHSSVVLTRAVDRTDAAAVKQAHSFAFADSTISLLYAWFVNVAILMVAASAFHSNGNTTVATLEDAYVLLSPVLGKTAGSTLFAVALLASAQNATLTGTLTGQIVMEGFTTFRISPLIRRTATRLLAIVPAVLAVAIGGDGAANYLLIVSQVSLSFALPFAIFPLVHISSSQDKMGGFTNPRWLTIVAYTIGALIASLNILVFAM